jgi:hypothetical protein
MISTQHGTGNLVGILAAVFLSRSIDEQTGEMFTSGGNLSFLSEEATTYQMGFCSGIGQYHSVNNPLDPKAYLTITGQEVEALAVNPPSVPKPQAKWAIFSNLHSRTHSIQREHGQYGAAWLDIDQNKTGFENVIQSNRLILPGTKFIAYLTRSATPENHKCRVIAPFAGLCLGADYALIQKILNDRLEAAGITPDRATERAGQVCYLPNRGELYRHHIEPGDLCNRQAVFADELAAEKEKTRLAELALQERREQARQKATQ